MRPRVRRVNGLVKTFDGPLLRRMTEERIALRAPTELLDRLDRWRGAQTRIPTRSEAVRLLLAEALDAIDARNQGPARPDANRPRRTKIKM